MKHEVYRTGHTDLPILKDNRKSRAVWLSGCVMGGKS